MVRFEEPESVENTTQIERIEFEAKAEAPKGTEEEKVAWVL